MASTTFINGVTLTDAGWFNDVNTITYTGLTTQVLVGGGTGSVGVWTAATGTGSPVRATSPILVTPVLGVAVATSLATSAASPLLMTNGQLVTVALTSQTVGATTLTIPDFASVVDEFTFKTKAQTMSNKTFVAPALGTPASAVLTNATGYPPPTRQVFLTGTAATYTTPTTTGGAKRLVIRMKGSGGGSGGSANGANDGGQGGDGGATIFNSINANGGKGGTSNSAGNAAGGAGGSAGSGSASLRIPGAPGQSPSLQFSSATNCGYYGGNGGGTGGGVFGGGVAGSTLGVAGKTNSGGGAAGAGTSNTAIANISTYGCVGGGGEGEYVEIVINSPAATYTYTIGAAGTAGAAGTGGAIGAIGGTGWIVVDEYY